MAFTLDYSQSGVSRQELSTLQEKLKNYVEKVLSASKTTSAPESFLRIDLDDVEKARVVVGEPVEIVVLFGIGGSSLGASAIAQALGLEHKLLVLDTIDSHRMRAIQDAVERAYNENISVRFVVVSKSGTTEETLENFNQFREFIVKYDPSWKQKVIIVTDEGTPLWQTAEEEGFQKVASPQAVPGRFSLFTSVGLVPLVALGADVAALCNGALSMAKACLEDGVLEHNPATWGSAVQFSQARLPIHVLFATAPEFVLLTHWWRQLIAESLGKQGKGITPLSSDPADVHSMLQLYLDGPRDKFTLFIDDAGKMGARLVSTYREKKIPYGILTMETRDAGTLGAVAMLGMIQVVLLAYLFEVNPFDQPAVTSYKEKVK